MAGIEPNQAVFFLLPGFHMPVGAGQDGANLIAGTCAFADRPVRPGEPDKIRFYMHGASHFATQQVVTSCLADKECAIEICVKSNLGLFEADPATAQMNYPKFKQ